MPGNDYFFVEWKEQFVSQERGNRIVHYFLKDSAGESILAVVGTERSVRHMFYVVSEEFVRVYGAKNSIHAGFKWRSRREVVDWLTSMLSKQHMQGDQSKLPKCDSAQASGSSECPMNWAVAQQTRADQARRFPKNLSGHNLDIVWSGVAWMCGKQLKHYPAFCRNGTTIAIQSFVFVMAKEETHYVAYLEDMYEDKRGQKKVKVRWFHHNQEVKGVVALRNPHPKEVFITPYAQVISAECVDGPATVLSREHYEKCLAIFPHPLLARVHMCSRQFRNNKVKPFDLSKLRGYFDQPILSCLNSGPLSEPDPLCHGLNGEDYEEPSEGENVKSGSKRTRSGRAIQRFATDHSVIRHHGTDCQMIYKSPPKNLKYGLSDKRLLSLKDIERQPWYSTVFKAGEKIELLCQDSGIRGCWFRCTVLQASRKQIKVQYDDVQDGDGYGNLEEWVPAVKLAVPDKLGMRYSGRLTVRPTPPNVQTDFPLDVGTAIDAWWSDGWWEGIVTGVNNCADDTLQVYFPGENIFLSIHKKDLRISRDWLGDQWIDIEAKPGILSVVYAAVNSETKVSSSSTVVKDVNFDGLAMSSAEILATNKLSIVEEEEPKLASLASSTCFLQDMGLVDSKKLSTSDKDNADGKDGEKSPSLKEKGDEDGSEDTNFGLHKVDDVQNPDAYDNVSSNGGIGKLKTEFDPSEQNCEAVNMQVTAQEA